MNRILMIAFDFPPCKSAGVQRTLKFCEHLSNYNWEPIVLTAKPNIYNVIDKSNVLPDFLNKNIYRSYGFNVFKHFSIKGKYFSKMALPDAYSTWYYHSVILGMKIINKRKPDVIWSTHPYLTTHRIAAKLKRISKLPWVADFRDPFKINSNNPAGLKIDIGTVTNADLLIFATDSMRDLYVSRFPAVNIDKFVVIENGYNEEAFSNLRIKNKLYDKNKFTLLHSGELYEDGRNPMSMFRAVKNLTNKYSNHDSKIKILFRGATNNSYQKDIINMNLQDIIEFVPSVSYMESIRELNEMNALVVIQGNVFNAQIPGKVYEYLRAKKPILALVGKDGATARLLTNVDHAIVVDINNENEIEEGLVKIQELIVKSDFDYRRYDRQLRSKELANYLDDIIT